MQFFHQIFSPSDLLLILFLFFMEALLSVDNAAVIATIARKLPEEKQGRALWIGISSGFVLRGIMVLIAGALLRFEIAVLIGGLYLIYLTFHHFYSKRNGGASPTKKVSFWKSVALIEGVDAIFAIDSILSAFAIIMVFYPTDMIHTKMWIVYVAGILGMLTMRLLSRGFIKLLKHHPYLESFVYLFIALVGLKLVVEALFNYIPNMSSYSSIVDIVFWIVAALIGVFAFIQSKRYRDC